MCQYHSRVYLQGFLARAPRPLSRQITLLKKQKAACSANLEPKSGTSSVLGLGLFSSPGPVSQMCCSQHPCQVQIVSSQNIHQHPVSLRVLLLGPPPQIDLGPSKLPVARPMSSDLKPSCHRKRMVAGLCLLYVRAESLVLNTDPGPSMASEKQELVGIYETCHGCPCHCLERMSTAHNDTNHPSA